MIKGTVDSWSISADAGTIVAEDGSSWSFRGVDVIESEQALPGARVEFAPSENAGKAAATIRVLRRVDAPIDVMDAVPNLRITDIRLPFLSVARLVVQVTTVALLLWLLVAALMGLLWG